MVLYLWWQAEADAKLVSSTDNPYLAQIAQARAAAVDRTCHRTRPGRTPVHPGLHPLYIQARVAAVNQVAREEREALAAAADADGDAELMA